MIERYSTKALAGVVAVKLLRAPLDVLSSSSHALGRAFTDLSDACFFVEAHFGRRYEAATGVNLLELIGRNPDEYREGVEMGSEEDEEEL